MALFGKKKTEETKKAPKVAKVAAPKTEEKTVAKPVVAKVAAPKDSTAYRVLVRPIVSEKTSRLEKNRQFTFVVTAHANKVEIKKAVERHYRVHVTKVNVINVIGKSVRSGRTMGKRKDWRKAYVTVRPGENITF
jgi:large subunit ribosomal protein L23